MHHYSRYDNFASTGKKDGPLGLRDFVNTNSKQMGPNPQNWTNLVDKIDVQLKDYLHESAKLTDQLIKKNKKIQKEAKRRLREQDETDSSEEEESQYVLVAPNSNSRFNALDARDQPIAIPVKPLLAYNPRSKTLERTPMLLPDTNCKGKKSNHTPRSGRSFHDENCCLAKESNWSRRNQHQQSCDTDRRHFHHQGHHRQYETQDSGCCNPSHKQHQQQFVQLDTPILTASPDGVYRLAQAVQPVRAMAPTTVLYPAERVIPVAVDTYPQSLREQYIKYRLEPVNSESNKKKDKYRDSRRQETKKHHKQPRKRQSVLSDSMLTEEKSVIHDDDRDDGVSVSAKSGYSEIVKNGLAKKAKDLKEKEKALLKNVINSQNNMIREISQEAQNQIGERQLLEERIQVLEQEIEREKSFNCQKEKEVNNKLDALQAELEDARKEKRELEYQREVELRALELAADRQAALGGKSRAKNSSSRTDLANRRSTVASVDLSGLKDFGKSSRSKPKTPRTSKKTVAKVNTFIKGVIQASLDELEQRNRSKSPHVYKCCLPYAESRTAKKKVVSTRDGPSTNKKFNSQSVDRNIDFLHIPIQRHSMAGSMRKSASKADSKYDLGKVALETGLFATESQIQGDQQKPAKRRLIRDNLVTALKKKARGAVIDSLAEMVVKKLRK
jgi:hypothetical protein